MDKTVKIIAYVLFVILLLLLGLRSCSMMSTDSPSGSEEGTEVQVNPVIEKKPDPQPVEKTEDKADTKEQEQNDADAKKAEAEEKAKLEDQKAEEAKQKQAKEEAKAQVEADAAKEKQAEATAAKANEESQTDAAAEAATGSKEDEKKTGSDDVADVSADAITSGASIVLKGVTFEYASARLRKSSSEVLDEAAETLKAKSDLKVEIAGYTDSTGSEKKNKAISQKRAEAVKKYLVSKGVKASQLSAKGYGPASPVASNDTKKGREKNRRVELHVK